MAHYVKGTISVDFNYALTTLLQLRVNAKVLSHHFEDSVWAKFDEVEHLIRENGYTLTHFGVEENSYRGNSPWNPAHGYISKHSGVFSNCSVQDCLLGTEVRNFKLANEV